MEQGMNKDDLYLKKVVKAKSKGHCETLKIQATKMTWWRKNVRNRV